MSNCPEPAVVCARPDGIVVEQNETAETLMGEGVGRTCWDLVGGLEDASGLPCQFGCVGELLAAFPAKTHLSRVRINGTAYRLLCVPTEDLAVCVLDREGCALPQPWEALTKRERQVLRLVADGHTSPEVAAQLGISEATVRSHVEHMRNKLGVATRAGLVARAFRLGVMT